MGLKVAAIAAIIRAMKKLFVCLLLTLTACSSGPKPKYVEEKNQAKFANNRAFAEAPEKVLRAAKAVLDSLAHDSEPASTETLKINDNTIATGWVYKPASRDKYVQYDYNGAPQRKELTVRRIYQYTVSPSLAGSQVDMDIKEEIQQADMKTGQPKGWKRVDTEKAAYDMLITRLREQIRME